MSYTGRLLVATPLIGDPNFERAVVFLLAHGNDGAFGVVINRPSDTGVESVAPGWGDHVAGPGVVFVGGPVAGDAVVGIGRPADGLIDGFTDLSGGLGTVDLHHPPTHGARPWIGLRLYAGSAGWGAGQLEEEIAEGAWWPVDSLPDDILTGDPTRLWERVLRRQVSPVSWFANCPHDPSSN
ncbi:MAG: YqgE/AlgH family protein [Aquihabitans sp.]